MKDIWYKVSNIGISEHLDSSREIRRVRLLNRFVAVIYISTLVAFFFQFVEYQIIKNEFNVNSYLMLVTHLPLGFVFLMHKKSKYVIARVFFIVYNLVLIVMVMVTVGSASGVPRILLIFPVAIIILFDDIKTQIIFVSLTALAFVIAEIISNYIPPFLEENLKTTAIYPIFIFQLFLIFVLLLFYKNEITIAEEKLEEKNKELEQFTRVASHDLKQPARTISSFSSLIQRRYKREIPDEVSEYLEFISSASTRMINLLDDLLNYAVTGNSKGKMSTIDLNEVLKESIENLDAQISESKAILEISDLPIVKGYRSYLTLLFQNIISNGIKFQPENQQAEINITTKKDTRYHVITFQDNGIGIEKKYLDSIFNTFTRLHSKKEYEGSGIGLATCKKIVNIHQGKIEVESEPGAGTRISLFFKSL